MILEAPSNQQNAFIVYSYDVYKCSGGQKPKNIKF